VRNGYIENDGDFAPSSDQGIYCVECYEKKEAGR